MLAQRRYADTTPTSPLQFLFTSFEPPLTCHVGELVLQGADVGHIDVEEGAELGHSHANPGDGDVCQATAAVH